MTERTPTAEEFAKFIRDKRIALGLSQEKLAVKIYGDRNRRAYISQIETGKRKITMDTMDTFLDALGSGIQFVE